MNFDTNGIVNVLPYILTGFLSYLLTLYSTPISIQAALRYKIVDTPDGRLKSHNGAVALLGGLSVLAGFLLTISFTYNFNQKTLGILLGGTIIVIVGLLDDLKALTPRIKFCGQLFAVWVLVRAGIRTNLEFLDVGGYIPQLLSMFWLLSMINAFNIIDVMDGVTVTVALSSSIFFCIVAIINGNEAIIFMTLAMAGSLLGFMKFNLPPARIYLGDTGSMLIGLVLGSIALIGSYTKYNKLGFFAPLLILSIPIFDMIFVMYHRRKKGISPFFGSPDHFVLRLKKHGFGVKNILVIINIISYIFGISAIITMYSSLRTTLIVLSIALTVVFTCAFFLSKIKVERITSRENKEFQG